MGGIFIYTPIYDAILKYSCTKPTAFHTPGHKLGKGIPPKYLENIAMMDLTEIPGTDNLHYPEGAVRESQELAAQAFHADKTFFLVNGSTCGIHAMIMTMCKRGDKLIVSRDCHKSVINGMILAGVNPVYVKPGFDEDFGIPTTVSARDIDKCLEKNSDAVGVLITRPNYYGICADIKAIADIVHRHGKILAVDEAHGAHLVFSRSLPVSAMQAGADICVQSAHKTLPALTQCAYLHVKSRRIDMGKLAFNLRMLQTTSPSYILMAFLDIARAIMYDRGEELISELLENINRFIKPQQNNRLIKTLHTHLVPGAQIDKTRLVINTKGLGKTGFEIDQILRERYNIQVEMADLHNIICISTIADTNSDFDRLEQAIEDFCTRFKDTAQITDIIINDTELPVQEIQLADITAYSGVVAILEKSVGKISREMLTPYPPGIPLVCPGERITDQAVKNIYRIVRAGGMVNGLGNNFEVNIVE